MGADGSPIGSMVRIGWRQRLRSVAETVTGEPDASSAGTRMSSRSVRRKSRVGTGAAFGVS